MDCSLIREDLVGYHLAALDDAAHARVEEHLVACPVCLRSYLALKRHVDRAGAERPLPSDAARARLKAAVAFEFRLSPRPRERVRRLLARRIPLVHGVAAALAAAIAGMALVALGPGAMARLRPAPEATRQIVDSARAQPASLTVY